MKDQITHLPDNADRSVAKQKFKITNWPTYNKALINRGSIMVAEAMALVRALNKMTKAGMPESVRIA
ncbi:hypothetical protein D3M52_27720 [Klebsiella pneumoniae]|nr:hypothetical protein [Klebsiella pneumoniae]